VKEKVVENKKDEMKEYMEQAAALIHTYVPPDPAKIQAAKEAGRIVANPQAGRQGAPRDLPVSEAGDSLTLDVDGAANRLTGLGVNTYLDKPDEPVTLAVQMNALADGALYAAQTTLEPRPRTSRS